MNWTQMTDLYRARDAARVVYHGNYDQQVGIAIAALLRAMQTTGDTAMRTANDMAAICNAKNDPNAGLLFQAAAIEMLEEVR